MVYVPVRAPVEFEAIIEQVDEMLLEDAIQLSMSLWAPHAVLVKKFGGTLRFCLDYRRLMKKDLCPLPRIDYRFDRLYKPTISRRWASTSATGKSKSTRKTERRLLS